MATNLVDDVIFLDPLPEPQPGYDTTDVDLTEEEWVEVEGRITLLAACKDGSLPVEKIASKVVQDLRKLRKSAAEKAAKQVARVKLESKLAVERGAGGNRDISDQVSELERTCNDLQIEADSQRDEADNLAAELACCREELRQYQDERPETTGTNAIAPEFNKAHNTLHEELATSQKSMQELQTKYDRLQAQSASLEGELSAWRDRAAAGASATSAAQEVLRQELAEYQKAAVSSGAEVMLLKSELTESRLNDSGRADLLAELASAKAMAASASESRAGLRAELTEARAVASAAGDSRSALRAELLEERTAAFTTSQTSDMLLAELQEARTVAASSRESRAVLHTELLEERARKSVGSGADAMAPTFSSLPGNSEDFMKMELAAQSAENKARSAENLAAERSRQLGDLRSEFNMELRQREEELRKMKISNEKLGEELLETSRENRQLKLTQKVDSLTGNSHELRLDSPPENHKSPPEPMPFASTLNFDDQAPSPHWLPTRESSAPFGGVLDRNNSIETGVTPSTLEPEMVGSYDQTDAKKVLENRIYTLTNRVRQMDEKVRQQQQELEHLQGAAPGVELESSVVPEAPALNSRVRHTPGYAASDGPLLRSQERTPMMDVSLVPGGLNTNLDHSFASSVSVLNRTDSIMQGARLAMERVASKRSLPPQILGSSQPTSQVAMSPPVSRMFTPQLPGNSAVGGSGRAASPTPQRMTVSTVMSPVVRPPVMAVAGHTIQQTVVMSPMNSPRSESIIVRGNGTVPPPQSSFVPPGSPPANHRKQFVMNNSF